MPHTDFDLAKAAIDEMLRDGFHPDFPAGAKDQLETIRATLNAPQIGLRDMRDLLWSSIDNASSRDLDQIEVAEQTPAGIRILVAIADVDSRVTMGTPLDQHAASETTTVYTVVRTFPMLPEELSTDLSSLNENADRPSIVIEMMVASDGTVSFHQIYRALVRNKAQLSYEEVGPWLEGSGAVPAKLAASPELAAQLKLQDQAARQLRDQRHKLGALTFDRIEAQPIIEGGKVKGIAANKKNRASDLIEDFMIAANQAMAQTLKDASVSGIRRVVKSPERWQRIVELASRYGERLPAEPDSGALNVFLQNRKAVDPVHYADVSLAVLKLMGPGEYVLARPGDQDQGHFGLAAHDYTHSTAPNRRFADLVTQRLIKAVLAKQSPPYSDTDLAVIAQNCTLKEDAARKVERAMTKRAAAVALHDRIGQTFSAVVTGVTPSGVFVRIVDPPVEGRVMRGEQGLDVGDQVKVTLLATDAQRGFIDFAR
ncbi:MAG: RNB domain-containing ribonuclease [Bryobacteraceae bacterium]